MFLDLNVWYCGLIIGLGQAKLDQRKLLWSVKIKVDYNNMYERCSYSFLAHMTFLKMKIE